MTADGFSSPCFVITISIYLLAVFRLEQRILTL